MLLATDIKLILEIEENIRTLEKMQEKITEIGESL